MSLTEEPSFFLFGSAQLNMVWVSCEGLTSADQEHIGNLTYTPFRGFPAYYFPYKNVPGYLSPIIAVQFAKPEGDFVQ